MMSVQERFSDRLIAAEKVDAKRKERYEMQLQQLLNPTLSTPRRILCALLALLGLGAGANFAIMVQTTHMSGDYDWVGRAFFVLMAVLFLAFGLINGKMAVKGSANLRRDVPAVARIRWGMSFVVVVVALVLAWCEVKYNAGRGSAFYGAIAVAFAVFGAIHVITDQIRRSGLNTQEKLLEIELRLTEVSDRLANG